MLAMVLGAGFSKWAADLPVASQLFDFEIEVGGPRDARRLDIVRSCKEAWDASHPGGLAEQFIADALDYHQKQREAVLWYIARRLSELFIWKEWHAGRWRRHALMIDENRRFEIEGVVRARNFLQRFCGPELAGIITTNYDMLVEYALSTRGFNYGMVGEVLTGRGAYPVSQWLTPVRLRGSVPVAKIHGSVSWDESGRYTDGRRAVTGGALIVAPTADKQPPVPLTGVWDLAGSIVERASALLVFGFAFNPYDEAVLGLLGRRAVNLESVLLVDVDPKVKRACGLWPDAPVVCSKPPPGGDSAIRGWYRAVKEASQ